MEVYFAIYSVLCCALAILGNGLLAVLLMKHRELRNKAGLWRIPLLVVQTLISFLLLWSAGVWFSGGKFTEGTVACNINAFLMLFLSGLEILAATIVAVERYATLCLQVDIVTKRNVFALLLFHFYIIPVIAVPMVHGEYISRGNYLCLSDFSNSSVTSALVTINGFLAICLLLFSVVYSNLQLVRLYRSSLHRMGPQIPSTSVKGTQNDNTKEQDEYVDVDHDTLKKQKTIEWTKERTLILKSIITVALVILGWTPVVIVIMTEFFRGFQLPGSGYFISIAILQTSHALTPYSQFYLIPNFKSHLLSWFI
jgi:hypothetical protein